MDSVVQNELDSSWMHTQGIYGYDIVLQDENLFFSFQTQLGLHKIQLSDANAVSILALKIWRSAQQPPSNKLIYFSIQSEMSHAWGGGGLGNKFEEVVIVDLKKLESVFQFIPNWHYEGSEGNEEFFMSWNCHYQSQYHLSGDSLAIENVQILAAEKMGEEYQQETESEPETTDDPDCHPKLEEGLYLYDGNTFVKQAVKEEDK